MVPIACGVVAQERAGTANVLSHVQDNFLDRYKMAAAYWSCVNLANFFLVRTVRTQNRSTALVVHNFAGTFTTAA